MSERSKNLFNGPHEGSDGKRGFWTHSEDFMEDFEKLEKNIKEYKFGKEEFTEGAWGVIGDLAQEKAKDSDYNCTGFCGSEHIALAMDSEKDKKELKPILSKLNLNLNSFKKEIIEEIKKRRAGMEASEKEEINKNLEKPGYLPINEHFQNVLILARGLAEKTKEEKITIRHLFASIITESIEILIRERRRKIGEKKGNIDIETAALEIKDDLKEIISPSVISAVLSKNPEAMEKIEKVIKEMRME